MNDSQLAYQALLQKQALPLEAKISMSKRRIREWYEHWGGGVYISFSGGKDSTVLLHLVRSIYPKVPAVFSDTGLEYPEIREFVGTIDNVEWIKPRKTFLHVIQKHGYPVISKDISKRIYECHNAKSQLTKDQNMYGVRNPRYKISQKYMYLLDAPFKISHHCCYGLKKSPFRIYENESKLKMFSGIIAAESRSRENSYISHGCNIIDSYRPQSRPIMFWTEEDIWEYIRTYNLPISSIYKTEPRTGCMFCMFGVHLEKEPNKFQRMQKSHPKIYDYCINKLGLGEVLDYIGVPYKESPQLRLFE